MKILARFRQFGELRRLRESARRGPTPTTLGTLAERLISMGRIDEANRAAKQGLALFPSSRRLIAVSTFATKHAMKARIDKLRREMEETPNPSVFGRMAEVYRELGDDNKAIEICEQCIERFPLNENPYLISGAVRLDRFIEDMAATDGLEAEMQLRRVVKLNPQNAKAHLLLGKLYFMIGALEVMEHHVRTVIQLAPITPGLEKFLTEVAAQGEPTHDRRGAEDRDAEDNRDLPVRERIRSVEVHSQFRFPPSDFPATPGSRNGQAEQRLDIESMRESLGEVGRKPGVVHALILDRDGAPLADTSGDDILTRNEFADLMTDILRTAQGASRKMNVGKFSSCVIEGPFGGISIGTVKNISIGLKYDLTVATESAQELMEDFTTASFTVPGEIRA